MPKSKAVVVRQFRTLEGITVEDFELAPLEDGMLEVEVQYCGVNFADLYTIHQLTDAKLPFVLGIECAGVVTNVGGIVDGFTCGDRVLCYDTKGLHRRLVRVKHQKCYRIPNDIDFECAAASFVNYLTAWFSLFHMGHVTRNSTVFISSCAGGVGLAAINILREHFKDIKIYGSASVGKKEFLTKEYNVTFVSYNAIDAIEERFDLIIESQSTQTRNILMKKLKAFGKLVIIGAKDMISNMPSNMDPSINPIDLIFGNSCVAGLHLGILAEKNADLIREVLPSVYKSVRCKRPLIKVYDFENARAAYEELSSRQNIGKIVLKL